MSTSIDDLVLILQLIDGKAINYQAIGLSVWLGDVLAHACETNGICG